MSGATPGPWGLDEIVTQVGSCHRIGPFKSRGARDVVHACVYADGMRVGCTDPDAEELRANARLMAAAPELLAACEAARKWAAAEADSVTSIQDVHAILCAAIAKAKAT